MRRTIFGSAASLLALVAASGAAAQEGGGAAAGAAEADADEIIVTAERRNTSVQDTPLALSVLDGDKLRQGGNQGLTELAQQVPSLSIAQSFGIAQIFIRGVGNNFFSPGGDPGVATYADGVYLSDQEATAVAFLDLARIEVLRGPQGALYGRNATGGAVNLVSEGPTDSFEGRMGVQLGDFGRVQGDAVLSGPLGGGITARASVQYRRLDGFTRNELAGTPRARPGRCRGQSGRPPPSRGAGGRRPLAVDRQRLHPERCRTRSQDPRRSLPASGRIPVRRPALDRPAQLQERGRGKPPRRVVGDRTARTADRGRAAGGDRRHARLGPADHLGSGRDRA